MVANLLPYIWGDLGRDINFCVDKKQITFFLVKENKKKTKMDKKYINFKSCFDPKKKKKNIEIRLVTVVNDF